MAKSALWLGFYGCNLHRRFRVVYNSTYITIILFLVIWKVLLYLYVFAWLSLIFSKIVFHQFCFQFLWSGLVVRNNSYQVKLLNSTWKGCHLIIHFFVYFKSLSHLSTFKNRFFSHFLMLTNVDGSLYRYILNVLLGHPVITAEIYYLY